ncbi:TPA: ECs1072 family phage-associated protein [Escherichia coli]
MSDYSALLQAIKLKVCQNNNIPEHFLFDMTVQRCRETWYRIGQIFTLECVLEEYRRKNAHLHYHLDNRKALHHMIFRITKWKLEDIRKLSLRDSLFVIAEYLTPENMCEEAAEFLTGLNLPVTHTDTTHWSDQDWAPEQNSTFLQKFAMRKNQDID